MKKTKTKTGALPSSAGFPGTDMVAGKNTDERLVPFYENIIELTWAAAKPQPAKKLNGHVFWEQN